MNKVKTEVKIFLYLQSKNRAMNYRVETWLTTKREEQRLDVDEMCMLRWTCGVTRTDRIPNRFMSGSMKIGEAS